MMDDYHAFTSTSGGGGGTDGLGCSGSIFGWIIGIIAVLYIVGKLFG